MPVERLGVHLPANFLRDVGPIGLDLDPGGRARCEHDHMVRPRIAEDVQGKLTPVRVIQYIRSHCNERTPPKT